MEQKVLSILVDNTAGVLSRVSGLFSRRAYNIDSVSVGTTADPKYSRMTVVCKGDEMILEQITNQLNKLVDVRDIKVLVPDNSVTRELILVKVLVNESQRAGIRTLVDVFRAKIIDIAKDSMILELTGNISKVNAFLEMLDADGYEIAELARTGMTGLSRGSQDVRYL